MGELGKKFKEARENLGLSLGDVEEATKIRKKYLQALENENFEVIPGKTYARGFAKNYSNFLHLDTKEILAEFDILVSDSFKEVEYTPARDTTKDSSDREGKMFKYGLVIIAILLLFIAGNVLNNDSDNTVPNSPQESDSNNIEDNNPPASNKTPEKPEEKTEPEETQPENITGVKLEIEITKDQCWVSVISDGSQVFSGTLNQGDKRVFEGDSEITITLGNAGVAKVTYNGKEMDPLGAEGEVVTPPPFVAAKPQS